VIASVFVLIGLPLHAQDAPSATPAPETPAIALADPIAAAEPVVEASPEANPPVTDLLAPEAMGLTAAAAHDAALEAALRQASETGNPNATVVWGEAPEAAHAVQLHDAQGQSFQVGEASWYGADFAGLPTASGEIYDMYAYTVAHPSWPLGSIVRVENIENGRAVLARVNDRGPYAFNRILDCSVSIAQSLGFIHSGHTRVHVTLLDSAPDAWMRFEGFRAPMVVVQQTPHSVQASTRTTQADAVMALTEDTAPQVPVAATAAERESTLQQLITFRAASVLPYPAIAHAWDSLSHWLLGPEGESTRWHRIERAADRFGLHGFVRLFTRF
jgi:rare lipoprotein A